MSRQGQGYITEYLIRWKGYGPKSNTWYNLKDLGNAKELVKDYEEHTAREQEAALP